MTEASLRLDKWLFRARFFKSRNLASTYCNSGRLRLNKDLVRKAHVMVRPGDVLTFPLASHVRVIKILDLGYRRGPAPEARALYEDLAPPQQRPHKARPDDGPRRDRGSGRPTKAERRALDRLRGN